MSAMIFIDDVRRDEEGEDSQLFAESVKSASRGGEFYGRRFVKNCGEFTENPTERWGEH